MSKSSDLPQVSAGMTSTSAGRSTFEEYQRGNLKSWNDVDKHVDRPKKGTCSFLEYIRTPGILCWADSKNPAAGGRKAVFPMQPAF